MFSLDEKGVLGVASHSSALVADAAHSLSDLLSDFVTLWTVKVARLPPDPKHPYGYGKYEAVGSLSVGAILVIAGLGIGVDGFQSLQDVWRASADAAMAVPTLSLPFMPDLDRNSQLALAASAAGSLGAQSARRGKPGDCCGARNHRPSPRPRYQGREALEWPASSGR